VALAEILKWLLFFVFGQQALGLLTGAQTFGSSSNSPAPSSNPGVKPPAPSAGEIVKDAVNTPSSMWGLAALGFVAVFLVAQLRAAGHEVAAGTRGVYREAQSTTRELAAPDTSLKAVK
jgi:hypothetical protein